MPTVCDVAAYVLAKKGGMPAVKLQKLVFYAQAWSLVWDDAPLFNDRIEAWANGPVSPRLYACHRGSFDVTPAMVPGHPGALSQNHKDNIDRVLAHYGDKPSYWLSELTHMELPWLDARKGIKAGEPGNNEITHAAMAEYYGSLL